LRDAFRNRCNRCDPGRRRQAEPAARVTREGASRSIHRTRGARAFGAAGRQTASAVAFDRRHDAGERPHAAAIVAGMPVPVRPAGPRVGAARSRVSAHLGRRRTGAVREGVNYIYMSFLAMRGLAASRLPASHQAKGRAARWLRAIQNPDGGWGQSCESCARDRLVPAPGSPSARRGRCRGCRRRGTGSRRG
jgi:hypothetical protein